MNCIESGRLEIGVTRAQALRLVGARPNRLSVLTVDNSQVDPAFKERMQEAVASYRYWTGQMLEALAYREARGGGPLTMLELARITGVREISLTSLRNRGSLHGVMHGIEYLYPIDSVRQFILTNSLQPNDERRKSRGHMTGAFLRWYASNKTATLAVPA